MVEGSLTRTITNVKVTKMRDQDLCEGWGRGRKKKREGGREEKRKRERGGSEGGSGRKEKGRWGDIEIEIMSLRLRHGIVTEYKGLKHGQP
jgi:hypothetical protein